MAEAVYRTLQLGKEGTYGTLVAATTVYPCDPGSGEFTLNRATEIPDEDYGRIPAAHTGRGSHGVRIATASLAAVGRFEDIGHVFEMCMGSAVVSGTTSPYTYTFTADGTADTTISRTIEVKEDSAVGTSWVATGVLANSFDLTFESLAAGQNAMWRISADLIANDLAKGSATPSLSAPSTLETIEGHLTTLAEGPAGTAYASLSALSGSLISYQLHYESEKPLRPYGGTADKATAHGRRKSTGTVTMQVKLSSTTVTDFFDIYNVSGSVPTERRWRIVSSGSGTKALTIDHQLLIKDAHVEPDGRDGERTLTVLADLVDDTASLSSNLKIAIAGLSAAALP